MQQPSGVALHVEAAKRLLYELEQHANTAMDAIGADAGSEFAAVLTAVAALESHERLTRHDRDRLSDNGAVAVEPDSIASHYAAASKPSHARTLSVTG